MHGSELCRGYFQYGYVLQLKMSFKMGPFSDTQHTPLGIFDIGVTPPPPPPRRSGSSVCGVTLCSFLHPHIDQGWPSDIKMVIWSSVTAKPQITYGALSTFPINPSLLPPRSPSPANPSLPPVPTLFSQCSIRALSMEESPQTVLLFP